MTEDVLYMSAMEEQRHTVAQANATLDENGKFVNEFVNTRQSGEYTLAPNESVDLIDVSPKQLVSVAASLIPFLENDDANRALMGSNMQRQAVPTAAFRSAVRRHRHGRCGCARFWCGDHGETRRDH